MFYPSFFLLLLATYCNAQAVDIGRPEFVRRIVGAPTTPTTNAERFAAGMAPAAPQALAQFVRARPGSQRMRTPGRRQQAQPSPLPIPPKPNTDDLPLLFTDADFNQQIIPLQFPIQIFEDSDTAIEINNKGYVSYNNGVSSGVINAFRDDLVSSFRDDAPESDGYGIYARADATSLTVRWKMYNYGSPSVGTEDFTLYYTTTQPGVWFIYYGDYSGRGDGRQAGVDASTNTQYLTIDFPTGAFRTPNDRLLVKFDTARNRETQTTY